MFEWRDYVLAGAAGLVLCFCVCLVGCVGVFYCEQFESLQKFENTACKLVNKGCRSLRPEETKAVLQLTLTAKVELSLFEETLAAGVDGSKSQK